MDGLKSKSGVLSDDAVISMVMGCGRILGEITEIHGN